MTIKGPVIENWVLDQRRYTGARDINIDLVRSHVEETVVTQMDEEMGMPVNSQLDEYKVGGGLFSSGTVSPAIVFSCKDHPEYASIFVAFTLTGAILEVLVAQRTETSRNYQKAAAGKLFADKASAQQEDTYYGVLCQVVTAAVDLS